VNSLATIFALAQALGFKVQDLSERRIQEYGVSPFTSVRLYKYALIPAVLWGIIFVRPNDISNVVHSPVLVGYFIFIALAWNIQVFLSSYLMNTISSMSALTTLEHLLYFPLLVLVGVFFNHDTFSLYSLLAIVSLLAAFIIQPTQHHVNTRTRFSLPIMIIVGLVLLKAAVNAANNGVSRQALAMVSPEVFLGLFTIITIGLCAVWTSFLPRSSSDRIIIRNRWWLAAAIPLLWFAASIPETYGFAQLPIYTVVSIGAVTFALDTVSDLYHQRIKFDFRTGIFVGLTFAGMVLAIFSV
jgi:hypothetical protein